MSHTSTINRIVIKDLVALRAAVAELKRSGMDISMEDGGTPRAYYTNQEGMGAADHVIRIPGATYDVGVYRSQNGTYELRTDFYNGSVSNVLGATREATEKAVKDAKATGAEAEQIRSQGQLGKLYLAYSVNAVEQACAREGKTTQRHTNSDGTVQIMVAIAA